MRNEILLAGFGGQGIVMMGVLAAKAAGLYDGKSVAQSQSYGPAARGGACRSDVIISDEEIDYAKATAPNVLVLMSNQASAKYITEASEDSVIIIDSSLVDNVPDTYKHVYSVPATDIAEKELGARITTNVFMLSAVAAITGMISKEGVRQAITSSVRPQFIEVNSTAVDAGYAFGEKLLKD